MPSSASTAKSASASASARIFKHPEGNIVALLAAQAAPPPAKASTQSTEEDLLSQLALHAAPFPMASSTAPPVGQGLPNFSSMHPSVPAGLLRMYEKNFLNDNPNFSGKAAPHPSNLIRPPPAPTYYWVVTAGEKIGICHFPSEIDLSRIFFLPSFSVTRFEKWDDAVRFYDNFFKARDLGLAKFAELGDEDEPILVASNAPTPVQPKKKARFVFSKPTAPACSITAKTRVRKGPPSSSRVAAIDVPSDTEDTSAKHSKPTVIIYDDNDSSDFAPQSYRQASLNSLATPIRSRKRTAQEQEALEYLVLAERGSPVPNLTRPKKKSRAASEPAPSNSPAGDSDDLFLPDEDWASQPLLPLIFQGPPPSQASTSSRRPAVSRNRRDVIVDNNDHENDNENENEGLDDHDPDLPAYPLHSSKGKGKAKEVF